MSDKGTHQSSLSGYGMLAVAAAILFGITPNRKDVEKKVESESGQVPMVTPALLTATELKILGHKQFLIDQGIITKENDTVTPGTKFLILTLPDPIESQLGYWHDQSVDALTRAMGDSKGTYVLVDRWFPWTIISEDKNKNVITRKGDPKSEPGIVIYRSIKNSLEHIVVLIVGENATTGLRVKVLEESLKLAARVTKDIVRIVGPFCTGSQYSLGQTLKNWAKDKSHAKVRCITGTALGLKPWKEILTNVEGFRNTCDSITGTQVPFKHLNEAAIHYIQQPGRTTPGDLTDPIIKKKSPGKIAYLVEANSGFGDSVGENISDLNEINTLIYRFPMHIGRLAGIRSKVERERDERLGLIRPGEGQLVSLDQNRIGGDLIPAADENRTALLNQRLLADYWSAIRREKVQYVWIVATDKRDILFLLEQLHAGCPEVQPVVFGADLHYVHSDYLRFMRGVLVVGTYPLLHTAQRWQAINAVDRRRIPFPSSNSEGVYNAVLAIFDCHEQMVDYIPPRFSTQKSMKPPIWITTVGENSEFIPLAYFNKYADSDDFLVLAKSTSTGVTLPDSPFSQSFYFLVSLVAISTLVGGRLVWRVNRQTSQTISTNKVLVPGLRAQYVALVGIGATFAVLPLVLAFESARLSHDYYLTNIFFWLSIGLITLIVGGTFSYIIRQALLTSQGVALQTDAIPPHYILAPWQVVGFSVLAAAIVFGWLITDHSCLPESERILFSERAASLFSGCSPIVPTTVISLGLFGYGLLGLQQVRLMSEFRINTPYPYWKKQPSIGITNQIADSVCRIHDSVKEIDTRLRTLSCAFTESEKWILPKWVRILAWIILGIFTAGLLYFMFDNRPIYEPVQFWLGIIVNLFVIIMTGLVLLFVWRHVGNAPIGRPLPNACLLLALSGGASVVALCRAHRTWESSSWNYLFIVGFFSLVFLTLVASYRLYLLWKQVERITRAIISIPMVGAFDRFPDKFSRVFGAYLLSGRCRTLDLALPSHLIGQIRQIESLPNEVHLALPNLGDVDINHSEEFNTQRANLLCDTAGKLVIILGPDWKNHTATDAFGTIPTEPKAEPDKPQDWQSIAEQFIAVMGVIFLSQYFTRMRYLAYMSAVTSSSLLVAITSYQFKPEQFLMNISVIYAFIVIALLAWILFRINRNELVSRVTRSTPNKFELNSAFIQNLIVFVLPLLIVIVTQVAGRMRSVVEPMISWLR